MLLGRSTEEGIALVEILLVTIIIAIIVTMATRYFYQYHRQIILASIKNDVAAIEDGLNQYYYREGCDVSGNFLANKSNPDLLQDLGVTATVRPPIIVKRYSHHYGYQASILPVGTQTGGDPNKGKPNKTINAFEIVAALNPAMTQAQVEWYRQQLNAKAADGHTLIWTMLPSRSLMDSTAVAYKRSQQQTQKTKNGFSVGYTASNCVP